jgi:hypothetical protein
MGAEISASESMEEMMKVIRSHYNERYGVIPDV